MGRTLALVLGLILAVPAAGAWSATILSAPDAVSLRESLLVAGAVHARAEGGAFGAPRAELVAFDAPATVRVCQDTGSGDPAPSTCAGETTTGARLYVHAGGVVVATEPQAVVELRAPATAAAFSGPNVTLNAMDLGPGVYAGGEAVVVARSGTLTLRPLDPAASLELRGDEGFRTYNGTRYTMYISGVNETTLRARGAFVAGDAANATVTRAGLRAAEAGIRVEHLYDLLHALQPPSRADRRADLAGAFGPFQLVPPLLDGAAAARANFTLNGDPQGDLTFLRVEDLHLGRDEANWTGTGNASYVVSGGAFAASPGTAAAFPLWLPIVLFVAAIGARVLTTREPPRRATRTAAHAARATGLLLLVVLAAALLAPLLGFSPLAGGLAARSQAQLLLLCAGMVAAAWIALGLPIESLARSAFSWRSRPRAVLVPVLVGIAVAAVCLLLATPALLSFVARFVRL